MASAAHKHEPMAVESPWLTTEQAAAYLQISVNALRLQVSRNRLKPDQRGGRGRLRGHRFSRETLDRFIRGAA